MQFAKHAFAMQLLEDPEQYALECNFCKERGSLHILTYPLARGRSHQLGSWRNNAKTEGPGCLGPNAALRVFFSHLVSKWRLFRD